MKIHSCGAILYNIHKGKVYIVLGMEKGDWFPFKGTKERGESNIQAAIREINEETCGSVFINYIELRCNYSTKRKHYHIGLIKISDDEFDNFYVNKNLMLKKVNTQDYKISYMEKTDIKRFSIDEILNNEFHEITKIPIQYYYRYLVKVQRDIQNTIIIDIQETDYRTNHDKDGKWNDVKTKHDKDGKWNDIKTKHDKDGKWNDIKTKHDKEDQLSNTSDEKWEDCIYKDKYFIDTNKNSIDVNKTHYKQFNRGILKLNYLKI